MRQTRKFKKPTLQNTYGSMILPKGLILYHTSSTTFNPQNSMIFFTFHPSEWSNFNDEVITKVELKKNIKLFFMVKDIFKLKVISLLNTLTKSVDTPYKNLNKQYNLNLKCYLPYLKAENFDGWFSTVEIALINNPSYFTAFPTEKTNRAWAMDSDYKNNIQYPIYTQKFPIKLRIHIKYKPAIDKYMSTEIYFPFQLVLENADIEYFDGPTKDLFWKC